MENEQRTSQGSFEQSPMGSQMYPNHPQVHQPMYHSMMPNQMMSNQTYTPLTSQSGMIHHMTRMSGSAVTSGGPYTYPTHPMLGPPIGLPLQSPPPPTNQLVVYNQPPTQNPITLQHQHPQNLHIPNQSFNLHVLGMSEAERQRQASEEILQSARVILNNYGFKKKEIVKCEALPQQLKDHYKTTITISIKVVSSEDE